MDLSQNDYLVLPLDYDIRHNLFRSLTHEIYALEHDHQFLPHFTQSPLTLSRDIHCARTLWSPNVFCKHEYFYILNRRILSYDYIVSPK